MGTLYKRIVAALETAEQLDTFVSHGGPEALEALAAREELEGRTAMRNAVRGAEGSEKVEENASFIWMEPASSIAALAPHLRFYPCAF